jgi:replicative DNA helicase
MKDLNIGVIPPQALEVEQVVLGALLIESQSYYRIANIVSENSFYKPEHQVVFSAIKRLHEERKPVDLLTVTKALKNANELEKVGGPLFVTQLTGKIASSAHIEAHARIIAQTFIRRELIRVSTEALKKGYDESFDIDDQLNEIKASFNEIENIAVSSHSGKIQSVVLKNALAEIERDCVRVNKGETPGITTGFRTVDRYTGGWRPTNLIILAARPGVGKTSLALHFAKVAARSGKWVNFYGLEMTSEDLNRIIIAGESDVNRSNIRDGKVQESEWLKINQSSGNLEKLPILWFDQAGITADQIAANTRKNSKKGQCDLVIIDYLQLMTPTDKKAIREQQVSNMTRTLKRTALDSLVPVICLSQLNREASESQPQLHHLRESGAIEQDADIVIFPWIDPQNDFNLLIAKNRRGITGKIRINAGQEMTRFYEDEDFHSPAYNPNQFTEKTSPF